MRRYLRKRVSLKESKRKKKERKKNLTENPEVKGGEPATQKVAPMITRKEPNKYGKQ